MAYVIATRPGRTVRLAKNNVQKFAVVQPDGRFKFITDVNKATVFTTASELLQAIGNRAIALLKTDPTSDLTWAKVQRSSVTVTEIGNGH